MGANNDTFKDLFPSLIEGTKLKHGSIIEHEYWLENTWSWNLDWGRALSDEERENLDSHFTFFSSRLFGARSLTVEARKVLFFFC